MNDQRAFVLSSGKPIFGYGFLSNATATQASSGDSKRDVAIGAGVGVPLGVLASRGAGMGAFRAQEEIFVGQVACCCYRCRLLPHSSSSTSRKPIYRIFLTSTKCSLPSQRNKIAVNFFFVKTIPVAIVPGGVSSLGLGCRRLDLGCGLYGLGV